jgi:hypothetical protein
MIVILCHPGDAAALWLAATMRELSGGGSSSSPSRSLSTAADRPSAE